MMGRQSLVSLRCILLRDIRYSQVETGREHQVQIKGKKHWRDRAVVASNQAAGANG